MIIAKTIKGKGFSLIENKDGWHGKSIPQDKLDDALHEIGDFDKNLHDTIALPVSQEITDLVPSKISLDVFFETSDPIATREAYGFALEKMSTDKRVIALDAETSNSTFADSMAKKITRAIFRNVYC